MGMEHRSSSEEEGGTIRDEEAGDTMQITCRLCMEDKKLLSEG